MNLLECVPNVSEGRNKEIIDSLAERIKAVRGVKLLNVDSGIAANRTVYTFAGEPNAVIDAAYSLYQGAYKLINMANHSGTHPRQGAVDVCPFIPLGGMGMQEAVKYAYQLGNRIGKNLKVPGYYYEYNALNNRPSNLSVLRKGEYEGFPGKFKKLPPDFGEAKNWVKNGVTVIGARKLLIAYNVNLNTTDINIARVIAEKVRESGKVVTNEEGKSRKIEGRLKSVKGLGWYIEDFKKAQVSFNLTDIDVNGLWEVFIAVKEEAENIGYKVTGSELVGLAPLSQFLKVQRNLGIKEKEINWPAVIDFLGLNELKTFKPEEKIIEFLIGKL